MTLGNSEAAAVDDDLVHAFQSVALALQGLNEALAPHGREAEVDELLASAFAAINRMARSSVALHTPHTGKPSC